MATHCTFEPRQFTAAPQQTEGWIEFRDSPDQVFARVADHAAMGEWLPLVQKITVTHPHPVADGQSTVGTARHITFPGSVTIVETVVHWNPPHCYAYSAPVNQVHLKDYVGLFLVEPAKGQGGRFIFREYFAELPPVARAVIPRGSADFFRKALGNLASLIGGTEYAMTTVSHV